MAEHTTTECGGCTSSDLDVIFGHDCPNDLRLQAGRLRAGADVQRERTGGSGFGQRHDGYSRGVATEAQVRFLSRLLTEAGSSLAAEYDGPISKTQASGHIDRLLAQAKAQAPAARPARSNRYAAPCADCGKQVPAEAGALTKGATGWEVRHVGGCPAKTEVPAAAPQADEPEVPAGHYAVASATGNNDLDFYRVDHGTGQWAGRTFVKRIIGGRPDVNVRQAEAADALARIAADADAAARYGREVGRCCRCNRHLTDEASRAAGIGPECAKAA